MTVTDDARELIHEGTRLSHDVHGEGRVKEIVERTVGRGAEPTDFVRIEFVQPELDWHALLADIPLQTGEESMELMIPFDRLMESDQFHPVDQPFTSEELLEAVATAKSRTTPRYLMEGAASTYFQDFRQMLEDVAYTEDDSVVEAIRNAVDWAVSIALQKTAKQPAERALATLEAYEQGLGADLWSEKLYRSIASSVREKLDGLMAHLAYRLSTIPPESAATDCARLLNEAIERRLATVHGAAIRRSAESARTRLAQSARSRSAS